MNFIFGQGQKFFDFATRLAQLMWLNILTILCSLPVITVGSAFTALHTVLVKLYRDEEGKITPLFFQAFKDNFWQATGLWLVYLAFFALLLAEQWALLTLENSTIVYLKLLIPVLALIGLLSLCWAFVLQSRYALSLGKVLLFSLTRVIAFPLRSLAMLVCMALPIILTIYAPRLFIVLLMLGISGPAVLSTCFYNGALKIMEDDSEQKEAQNGTV